MLTLYHAPQSRSSRIVWLLEELEAPYELKTINISRMDGSGGADPANPHPDKKAPALVDDGALVTESAAICLYLTDKFPAKGIGPVVGDKLRGPYLTWLAYNAGVIEVVMHMEFGGLLENDMLRRTFRGRDEVDARILAALAAGPYLLGERFSAVDALIGSTGMWMRQMMPKGKVVDDYLARLAARPALARANAKDGAIPK
ncbi:MAG: glutathione S-transferase [Alphaproteobacteria bacterium]|nr:glutathione S-transferase [Alphaproteobacteria bacterium]